MLTISDGIYSINSQMYLLFSLHALKSQIIPIREIAAGNPLIF